MELNDYLRQLQSQNKSVHTVSNYQRDIESFLGFYLSGELLPTTDVSENSSLTAVEYQLSLVKKFSDWQAIDSETIRAFLAFRVQNGISARTLARQLSAIRSFYDYLLFENQVIKNPAKGLKAPKQPQPLPHPKKRPSIFLFYPLRGDRDL